MSEPEQDTRACHLSIEGSTLNICVETFREALREEINERDGLPCEVDITSRVPDSATQWTAAVECPHGVMYWVEPTAETVAVWERAQPWTQAQQ